MCRRTNDSISLPEPAGPFDARFIYRLTDEAECLLARQASATGTPLYEKAPTPPATAEALADQARRERKRQRRKEARARGARLATICGRWRNDPRGGRRIPDLRLSGDWLKAAGFDLGQEYVIEIERGKLTLQAI